MRAAYSYVYALLPALLWPLAFLAFREVFVQAMLGATLVLAISTVAFRRGALRLGAGAREVALGLLAAIPLYLVFVAGKHFLAALGYFYAVEQVYSMVRESARRDLLLATALCAIGASEEVYWRGGLLSFLVERFGSTRAALAVMVSYYTLVHVYTLNPALMLGALVVGAYTGLVATRLGLAAAVSTHVAWLYLVILLFPLG
ncbi:CPBP family glutamic-type intramembrane protease [Thermofilum pendens]|uniref:Abortive infection protein n=1 Tax=Thermofilum pendens (strain DSM 2475 / Hrk 5) TaxID=368408 RepID=A1S0D8_THEPD|nr:CPBP family glutamic-type intramembrane protease [Thermofilum pendens]ABL78918.1 Abortive infection protein [Thermofilum pendens Hrk 5]